jgi:hypothetical protein
LGLMPRLNALHCPPEFNGVKLMIDDKRGQALNEPEELIDGHMGILDEIP